MSRFCKVCCLLLLCSWYQTYNATHPFYPAWRVIQKTMVMVRAVEDFWSLTQESKSLNLINPQLYNELIALSTDIEGKIFEIIDTFSQDMADQITIAFERFSKLFVFVQFHYEVFIDIQKVGDIYPWKTIHLFANETTSPSNQKLQRTLEKMHQLFFDENYMVESLLSFIANYSTEAAVNNTCRKSQSKQQLISDLHDALINSTVIVMLVTSFSYDVKSKYEKLPYKFEREQAEKKFMEKINKISKSFKRASSMFSREVWRCDPLKHIKEVTYDNVEQIFQGFFVDNRNIADMVQESGPNFAMNHKCNVIKDARLRCTSPVCEVQSRGKMECIGHLRDCQNMPRFFEVCYSELDSERRYDWVRQKTNEDIAMYGEYTNNCHNRIDVFRVNWTHSDLCVCNCESEKREAARYFSLLDDVSDEGKVVTGVRLIKDQYVFHIQIQQGTLGLYGTIADQPQWKNVRRITRENLLGHKVSTQQRSWVEFYKNDLVYAVTYNQSYMYMDTLMDSDPTKLVTGLRFQQVGDALKLVIRTTPFDYTTGKLKRAASLWISSDNNGLDKRNEVILTKPGNPTAAKLSGPDVVSSNDKYVRFRMTDLEKDVGSYTVPFLDLQEVTTNPPMPLSGAGLIHRGRNNSGGFLGLQIIHYDYTG